MAEAPPVSDSDSVREPRPDRTDDCDPTRTDNDALLPPIRGPVDAEEPCDPGG